MLTEQEPVSQFRFFSLKRIQTIVAFSEHTAYLPWLLRNSSYARNFNFPCITFLSLSLFQNLHLPFLPSPELKPPRSPCSFLNLLSRFFSLSPPLPPSLSIYWHLDTRMEDADRDRSCSYNRRQKIKMETLNILFDILVSITWW